MTEQEREELIEKMVRALAQSHVNGLVYQDAARAALAVAEPVIREQAQNALREENARLRAALKPFVPKTQVIDATINDTRPIDVMVRAGELRAAVAAIKESVDE